MIEENLLNQGAFTAEAHTQLRNSLSNKKKEKGYNKPIFNPRNSTNRRNERNSQKPNTSFRCGLEEKFISNFPKPGTFDNKVQCNT